MDKTPIHIDEFGTISFSVFLESGSTYDFAKGEGSDYLFVTLKDNEGKARLKRVVDTTKQSNSEIVEIYTDYLKEQNGDNAQ